MEECTTRGYVVHSVMTNSVGVILAHTAHATSLIDNGMIITSISPHSLPTHPFRQLEPQWAFKLAISGIGRYEFALVAQLDLYFTHAFVTIKDDHYCFLMRDWPATKRVLLTKSKPTSLARTFPSLMS